MIIGIPKEILEGEKRVAAIPETVVDYIKMGFKVLVEINAGKAIFRDDSEYEKSGAEIVKDAEVLFKKADIVLKVKQLEFNAKVDKHEVEMMRDGGTLITFLHPAAPTSHAIVKRLREKNVTSFTMDSIPRTLSNAQIMDALTSMSTVTGYRAVLIAAHYLPRFIPMISTPIGANRPAKFLIIGNGVVGLQAVATAKRLGGIITVVDIRPEAREQATSLGAKIGGFEVPEEFTKGKWGYAKALPADWLNKEKACLAPLVEEADAIIASALIPGETAPVLITKEMVQKMKPGSVVIDVAIDQGGNCKVTEPGRINTVYDIVICGTQNIPGSMPIDSTWLYANNMLHYVKNLFKKGIDKPDMDDEIAKASLVTYEGKIVHDGTLKALNEL